MTALMRSLMFVPGQRQRMIDKVIPPAGTPSSLALDVALLDLEDGVPPGEKEAARRLVAEALARPAGGPGRWVRVNRPASEWLADDLPAAIRPGCEGLVIPKVDEPDQLREVERAVRHREEEAGLERGSVRLIASVESARGLLLAPAIAASSERLAGLLFGAEDFANDIGLTTAREAEASELLYARSAVVVAAAAAGIAAFDGVWPDIGDVAGLRRDSLQARRLGFAGKSLIHPRQIAAINEVFSPSAAEVAHARRVVAAFEEAATRGEGATALADQLIDRPVAERARRVLERHAALPRRPARRPRRSGPVAR